MSEAYGSGGSDYCDGCARKNSQLFHLREQVKELEQYQLDCRCADFAVENDELRKLLREIHAEISRGTTPGDEAYILGRIEALLKEGE